MTAPVPNGARPVSATAAEIAQLVAEALAEDRARRGGAGTEAVGAATPPPPPQARAPQHDEPGEAAAPPEASEAEADAGDGGPPRPAGVEGAGGAGRLAGWRERLRDLPRFSWTGRALAEAARRAGGLRTLPLAGAEGVVVVGWSHLVLAAPKVGKTTTVWQSVRHWLATTPDLTVHWLSEESPLIWAQRFAHEGGDDGGGWQDRLVVTYGLGLPADVLLDHAAALGADVVVVDTVRSLLGIESEVDNAKVAARLGEWERRLVAPSRTRIFLHHLRKLGGEHGTAVAGGLAYLGLVDRVLELRRVEGASHPHRRRLVTLSRLQGLPDLYLDQRPDGRIIVVGEATAVADHDARRRVLAALSALTEETSASGGGEGPGGEDGGEAGGGEGWATTRQVWAALASGAGPGAQGLSLDAVTRHLAGLARDGLVERDPPVGAAARGRTVRWRARTPTARPAAPEG